MTVLQSLAAHYDRLRENDPDIPEFGYSREGISFCVILSSKGEPVDVMDVRDTTGKMPRPSKRGFVPRPPPDRTGTRVVPNFLWDKTAYALGVTRHRVTGTPSPAQRGEHDTFKAMHRTLLANTEDEGLRAVLAFLDQWDVAAYDDLPNANDMLGENVVFRLDGELRHIHERPAARRVWQGFLASQSDAEGLCLVTGERAPVPRLHPRIKGVRGAQSAGASIVSFNLDAFESFGRKQGDNAPVSERAVFAYTTALNTMLAPNSGRCVRIGDSTVLFWSEAKAAEQMILGCFEGPPDDEGEAAVVRDMLEKIARGMPIKDASPDVDENTRYHVLGLAPNAARLSVRYWHEDSMGAFVGRVAEHWRDLRLDPPAWTFTPAVWSILLETAAQHRADNIPATLGGALMRTILTGGRYPQSLFAAVIARMHADKDINARRVAICRACLSRDYRLGFVDEEISMSLNPDDTNVAYRLGRLFAVYENVQRAALGQINATIKDRYFGAASATPASVFPLLERNSANHLAALRKGDKVRLAHWFDNQIDVIVGGLDTEFPRSLRLEEQGRFAIGYHHQRAHRGTSPEDPSSDTETHEEN